MKILLIRPYFSVEKFYFPRFINEPLGVEYLASFIKKIHSVKILDAMVEGWNRYRTSEKKSEIFYQGLTNLEIKKRIQKYNPGVIGISWLFSAQNDCVDEIVKIIKEVNKNIKIIVGGPHASANKKEVLKENNKIDIVVYGEGELTLKELLDKNLENLENIKGISFRKNNDIIINEPREFITNLDVLPFPDRKNLPYKNYAKQNLYAFIYKRLKKLKLSNKNNRRLTQNITNLPGLEKIYYALHNSKRKTDLLPKADIVTSRGCPNRCTFCAVHNIWGHQCRMRSAENVLAEIDLLVKKYNIKHINFQDDNFNVWKKRTIDICKGIVDRNYKITLWAPAGAFVPTLDEETLIWLKKAGMHRIRMSIESGNQYILDNIIKKRIDLSKVKQIVDICKKIGIKTEGAFMFGVPGETIKTMHDTLNFAKNTGFDRIIKFIFQPFPNTELHEICVKNNYLTDDYDPRRIYITGNKCYVKTDKFSPEDVLKIINRF